jgi:hypothetical protein
MLLASDYDKSQYLKSEDIGDRERKFRIKDVTEEEVGEKKEKKLVVWLSSNDQHLHGRGLIVNKTNNRVLRAAFGDPVKGWIGKIIIIFTMLVDNRGKMTLGLRVRIPPPKQSAATAEPSQQPVKSGNGASAPLPAAAAPPAAAVHDPELEPNPKPSLKEELDDEIPSSW